MILPKNHAHCMTWYGSLQKGAVSVPTCVNSRAAWVAIKAARLCAHMMKTALFYYVTLAVHRMSLCGAFLRANSTVRLHCGILAFTLVISIAHFHSRQVL